MCYKKNNDIFEISVKNTFRSTYCNHRLNFAVDQRNQVFVVIVFSNFINSKLVEKSINYTKII